jgi:hypothetical protein
MHWAILWTMPSITFDYVAEIGGIGERQNHLRVGWILNSVFDEARIIGVKIEQFRRHAANGLRRYIGAIECG